MTEANGGAVATELPDEKTAIIEQLSSLAREDQQLRPQRQSSWTATAEAQNTAMLETSLAFLSELRLQTLEMLHREALRPDTLVTGDPFAGRNL
ncbi:MAG: hypothetical protein QOH40_1389, partial [Arthrobacter pascens]|nr:hypothetical protein [Arthrobacter pascens]